MTAFEKGAAPLTGEPDTTEQARLLTTAQEQALDRACSSIAPNWPLDRMIAVNPLWAMREQPIDEVAARLSSLAYIHSLMPPSHYLQRWQRGDIQAEHLTRAAAELDYPGSYQNLLKVVKTLSELPHWHNISDLVDAARDRKHKMAWRDEIIHQISQFCAAHYQEDGPFNTQRLNPQGERSSNPSLYQQWLRITRVDRGIAILMAEPGLGRFFDTLPATDEGLFQAATAELGVNATQLGDYAQALLLDINGWAAWVAYRDWQRELGEGDSVPATEMRSLLAIRLAWELVLWRYLHRCHPEQAQNLSWLWRRELDSLPELFERHHAAQRPLWVWQRAAELAYQLPLNRSLSQAVRTPRTVAGTPSLQAVFCIDVRSEPLRRALEQQNPDIQTLGFAGFFGLPLSVVTPGSDLAQPHLPGLLAPQVEVRLGTPEQANAQARQLNWSARFQEWSQTAAATFTAVEAGGLLYAGKLLGRSLLPGKAPKRLELSSLRWHWRDSGKPLTQADQVTLLRNVLTAMGLTERFASRVLLVGHGSHTHNNPHAAGLECGACGGQSGEVSVRALARLLNDPSLRTPLAEAGITLPDDCRFVPALHHTVTDRIELLEGEDWLSAETTEWLRRASADAQRERASALGLSPDQADLDQQLKKRNRDWSQTRPEWGLANNAAFIAAPRSVTAPINLHGRSFLHDYNWRTDPEFSRLELIMTAPLVVAHWINMQYNGSTLDNRKFGSGNKVLHNVVGGHIGVFEGNGGDLRIGLPLQSLHDGEQWRHEPLRLSAYLAAPTRAIDAIIAKHPVLQALTGNGWLYLFSLDDETGEVQAYHGGRWTRATD